MIRMKHDMNEASGLVAAEGMPNSSAHGAMVRAAVYVGVADVADCWIASRMCQVGL